MVIPCIPLLTLSESPATHGFGGEMSSLLRIFDYFYVSINTNNFIRADRLVPRPCYSWYSTATGLPDQTKILLQKLMTPTMHASTLPHTALHERGHRRGASAKGIIESAAIDIQVLVDTFTLAPQL